MRLAMISCWMILAAAEASTGYTGRLMRFGRVRHAAAMAAVLATAIWLDFAPNPTAAAQATPLTKAIDELMAFAYPADQPGAAIIVVKDGATVFRKAYGMANLELGVP